MAHITETIGVYAELITKAALMANGYKNVAQPDTKEYYDISANDPLTGAHHTFQVKTIKRRDDRPGDYLKIDAKNGAGKPYEGDNAADYYVGVLIDDGEVPRVFVTENRGITEYWSRESKASERWVELPVALDRTVLAKSIEMEVV